MGCLIIMNLIIYDILNIYFNNYHSFNNFVNYVQTLYLVKKTDFIYFIFTFLIKHIDILL